MLNRGTLSFLALALFGSATLVAQQQGGTGGGGAGQSTGGAAGGGTAPTTGQPSTGGRGGGGNRFPGTDDPNQRSPINQPMQPIFITGRVLMDDGTAPGGQVVIERVCQMRTYREGYADSKGYFNIQLGANIGVFADASTDIASTGFGQPRIGAPAFGNTAGSGRDVSENQLWNCEIRASLAGYRSDTISLATRRAMDHNDLGTIVLHNYGKVEGLTTSATSAQASKDARKSFDKGKKALEGNRPDEAQKELLKAVEMFPRYAEAWYYLGRVYEQRDHKTEARDAYSKALAADSKYVFPYERMYLLSASEYKWEDVAETTDKVLRLNPYDFPSAYYYSAVANFELKKLDVAEKSAREAAKVTGKRADPRAHYVLGVILAQKGEFAASSESLKAFLKVAPAGTDTSRIEKMITEVDRMAAEGAVGAKQ
jgi:tetratricopeptide (TPR) repeat protein